MEIEKRGVAELTQDPRNARSHDGKNIEAIKRSLQEFGQQKPIVVNTKGEVVAGNGTLAAALELGWEKIAVVETDLVGSSATAYAIADNRTAELAEWDEKNLASVLKDLDADQLGATGFSEEEADTIIEEIFGGGEGKEKPTENFSQQIDESNNYLVLVFDNDIDWLMAQTHFELETVSAKRANGKPWSKGVGRVVNGAEYLTRITKDMVG